MKKNIIIIVLISANFCFAQTPVIDIYGNQPYGDIPNAYYKDVNNFRDQFVGTWIYTNGNTLLKVTFVKKNSLYVDIPLSPFYEDCLVGEFQYNENGVPKANTLSNLDINYDQANKYNLYSLSDINNSNFPICPDCSPNSRRMYMSFDEPANDDSGLEAGFYMRTVSESGQLKLKVQFRGLSSAFNTNKNDWNLPSNARRFSLPYGDYTLIKEP